jgi:hypothetical protein
VQTIASLNWLYCPAVDAVYHVQSRTRPIGFGDHRIFDVLLQASTPLSFVLKVSLIMLLAGTWGKQSIMFARLVLWLFSTVAVQYFALVLRFPLSWSQSNLEISLLLYFILAQIRSETSVRCNQLPVFMSEH